jgi:hypothetical protein
VVRDIWEYFLQKEQEFSRYSAVPEARHLGETMFRALPGTDDQEGVMRLNLGLQEDAYVKVFEHVVVRDKRITRVAYAYTLIIDEARVNAWDCDPRNHPEDPVHEHEGPDRVRQTGTDRISLAEVLEIAWKEISLRAEAPPES